LRKFARKTTIEKSVVPGVWLSSIRDFSVCFSQERSKGYSGALGAFYGGALPRGKKSAKFYTTTYVYLYL
jgi:hypothetical protein